jgi:hypothetical protein
MRRHASSSNAVRAAFTAASISFLPPAGTSVSTSPVDGFSTANAEPPSTHSPPT